jgi:hypothetical protein
MKIEPNLEAFMDITPIEELTAAPLQLDLIGHVPHPPLGYAPIYRSMVEVLTTGESRLYQPLSPGYFSYYVSGPHKLIVRGKFDAETDTFYGHQAWRFSF